MTRSGSGSGSGSSSDTWRRRLLALGVLVAVVVVALFLRPAERPESEDATDDAAAKTRSGTPAVATDADYCASFRELADTQAAYVAAGDQGDPGALWEAADSLLDGGVPEGMSLPARSGYYTLIAGVYDSLGMDLEPSAVGAPAEPADGGDAAFNAYLSESCPP